MCLYCLHQLTRFFLFISRIRSFFFTSLLRYPPDIKILFTVLSDSLLAPFSLETFVNSVKVLRRLFFTSRISCLFSWTLHLRGLPLRFLFSVIPRLSCRFKKLHIVDIGLPVISDISFNFILALDYDKILSFSDAHSSDPFLPICFDSGTFADDKNTS